MMYFSIQSRGGRKVTSVARRVAVTVSFRILLGSCSDKMVVVGVKSNLGCEAGCGKIQQ